jgi:hypothetical protein
MQTMLPVGESVAGGYGRGRVDGKAPGAQPFHMEGISCRAVDGAEVCGTGAEGVWRYG